MTLQAARYFLIGERAGYARGYLPWLPGFLYRRAARHG